jgi:FkbM family methyltransferase
MAAVNPVTPSSRNTPRINPAREIDIRLTPFDQKDYRKMTEARGKTIQRVVSKLKPALGLLSAVDAGCGVGFFSQTLSECGLRVCGFDARGENVEEARRRFPGIPFERADVQDGAILQLGSFDLVLCFGLLYHLESPLLAIRHLRALTEKCLLLESMCIPEIKSSMLLREEPPREDQSLAEVACYPSEGSLAKMLYRAGFSYVYRVLSLPDHDDFRETAEHKRRRTVLLATMVAVDVAGFRLFPEPQETEDPWAKNVLAGANLPQRIGRFLGYPSRKKYLTLANRARRIFAAMPVPLRLPFGAWWLAENSMLDQELMYGEFERMELQFVEKLLRPGMTVLDIGAHHGLYALLASTKVGRRGRVLAFEPSPRECGRLKRHLRWNRCSNVKLVPFALSDEPGEADFYLVDGFEDGFNSLRPPATAERLRTVRVQVRCLDAVLSELDISKVDFIKLDVEGAEFSVLNGAIELLHRESRPAMLVEVQDVRTLSWGYKAREILRFLIRMDYRWFAIAASGTLQSVSCDQEAYDANLVALPVERTEEFLSLLGQK